MNVQWTGVYPALTTNLTKEEALDIKGFSNNVIAQFDAGVDGIVLGGSLGEASVLTLEEKEELVKVAVDLSEGKVPVILNIAESSTAEAVKLAKLAPTWGASGLMLLPPMRYKADDRETVVYFKTVAGSTDLPIMLYNNPVDYKIEITLNMFEELAESENIKAVKESTRDITNVTRMINRFGDRFKILCGVDTIAVEELLLGADGWVAGLVCAFPKETVAIYRLVKAGRIPEAIEIYRWFMPLLELDIHPKLVQYIKLAGSYTGLTSEYVRAPRLTITGEERTRITGIIEHAMANRPQLPDYLSIKTQNKVAVPSL